MTAQDTRQKLIETGTLLISRKGYHAVGLQEILEKASVPKGSFYHYFKSKEDFGVQIIHHNTALKARLIESILTDPSSGPVARLEALHRAILQRMQDRSAADHNVIGKLMNEISELSEPMRQALQAGLRQWKALMRRCLQEAQARGQIDAAHDLDTLADFIFDGWEGASLRARLEKRTQPLEVFCHYLFERILT